MRATLSSQHMKIVRVVEVRVTVTKPALYLIWCRARSG